MRFPEDSGLWKSRLGVQESDSIFHWNGCVSLNCSRTESDCSTVFVLILSKRILVS